MIEIHDSRNHSAILSRPKDGKDAEAECIAALQRTGMKAHGTKTTGDFGADVLAEFSGLSLAVQVKDLAVPVGIRAVQEVIGARKYYSCDFACVYSTSGFTDAARELASTTSVFLLGPENIEKLKDWITQPS